jgi:hypothetical protein
MRLTQAPLVTNAKLREAFDSRTPAFTLSFDDLEDERGE